MQTRRRVALAAWLLGVAGCGDKIDPGTRFASGLLECADPASPFCQVQTVFVRSCALGGCHVPGGLAPMSLEPEVAYENLVNVRTISYCPQGTRVVPGDPNASCLWQLVRDELMPLDNPPLSAEDKETIRAWIASGARR